MKMWLLAPALLAIVPLQVAGAETSAHFPIPEALVAEHKALHVTLGRAVKEAGALGAAARGVEQVLHPHFQREEEIALPPLALLPRLAHGETPPEMREVLHMTDQLEAELPKMLEEHKKVVAALSAFRREAVTAGREEYVEFADELTLHAQNEEQVLYPAALLVGRFVKLQLEQ